MKTAEVCYQVDYLGIVRPPHSSLVVKFLENNGPERVLSRTPYILRTPTYRDTLENLDRAIKHQIGTDQFLTPYRSSEELSEPFRSQFGRFKGAVGEIICEEFIAQKNQNSGIVLVSGQTAIEQIALTNTPYRLVEPYSFNFTTSDGRDFACPDGVGFMADDEAAILTDIFEYKASDTDKPGKNQKRLIAAPFLNRQGREILQRAYGDILGIPYTEVVLPESGELNVTMISVQGGVSRSGDQDNLHENFDHHIPINFPDMKAFTYFVLKILIGALPRYSDPNKYLIPIDSKIANTLILGRQSKRWHPTNN